MSLGQKESLPPITFNVPTKDDEKSTDKKDSLVSVLSDIKGLRNTLRYIKLNPKVQQKKSETISVPSKKMI